MLRLLFSCSGFDNRKFLKDYFDQSPYGGMEYPLLCDLSLDLKLLHEGTLPYFASEFVVHTS